MLGPGSLDVSVPQITTFISLVFELQGIDIKVSYEVIVKGRR